MANFLQFFLILFPFLLAIFLLVVKRWKADTTGLLVFIMIAILAFYWSTSLESIIVISLAGIIDSFKITLMVGASILMITYMSESGALKRIIVFIKTLRGTHQAWQILFLNFGLGCFFVAIGATPVSILPPIMLALGFPPVIAVALPAIGYDPLTTYALLAIPAVVFTGELSSLASSGILVQQAPTLQEVGVYFSIYMPIISTGIAVAMLFIAGGKKMIKEPLSLVIALLSGTTAGVMAIIVNYLGLVTLTGIVSGLAVMVVLGIYAKILGFKMIDRSSLSPNDIEIEKSMSLLRACSPWILLVFFAIITNFIPPVFDFLFSELYFPITIGEFVIKTRILWQAYTWVIVSLIISFIFLPSDKKTLTMTLTRFKSRGFRPMTSAAIFFAVAWLLNQSAPNNPSLNMVSILSDFTSTNFGTIFPFLVPFIGFFGGFVSGSEASSIVMFTKYHVKTSNTLGIDPITVGTSNGVAGGLASVITPAKVQNAAATIDEIGIEGKVISKTIFIAIMMILVLSILTVIWAPAFPEINEVMIFILCISYLILTISLFVFSFIRQNGI
ncbi:MAG: L-lactate permease [Candidatus Heimdallarchaeota archaeon]|nr:L-lactate permease [Candidatus Heimdallarchaeota archaeon]